MLLLSLSVLCVGVFDSVCLSVCLPFLGFSVFISVPCSFSVCLPIFVCLSLHGLSLTVCLYLSFMHMNLRSLSVSMSVCLSSTKPLFTCQRRPIHVAMSNSHTTH